MSIINHYVFINSDTDKYTIGVNAPLGKSDNSFQAWLKQYTKVHSYSSSGNNYVTFMVVLPEED